MSNGLIAVLYIGGWIVLVLVCMVLATMEERRR